MLLSVAILYSFFTQKITEMATKRGLQAFMILKGLPPQVHKEILRNQSSLEKIKTALKGDGVKLAEYFVNPPDIEEQVKIIAQMIFDFYEEGRSRNR
jgi:hypothetical protein